jgi:hypothetical protein
MKSMGRWRSLLLHALPITALVFGLMTRWFALGDRYIIFLYYHDMGPLYPDTGPFSRVTSSRYWMTGLVAGGIVMLLYTAITFSLRRLCKTYRPPTWGHLWGLCALILSLGIPVITMTSNEPTLPASHATQVTLATMIAVGLALTPGHLAANKPDRLLWIGANGLGLGLILNNLIHLEKLNRWLDRGATIWIWMMFISLAAGLFWLLGVSVLGAWRRQPVPGASSLLLAGFSVAYLLLPLMHYLVGTDGYYYISDSDNFFAQNAAVQLVVWLVTACLVLGLTWFRQRISEARQSP